MQMTGGRMMGACAMGCQAGAEATSLRALDEGRSLRIRGAEAQLEHERAASRAISTRVVEMALRAWPQA
jgi:hypothetical protein